MIAKKKSFFTGFFMIAGFFGILIVMFSPVFEGHNALNYLDGLYNSISKGSAYYIPAVKEDIKAYNGTLVDLSLDMKSEQTANQTATLLMYSGELVNVAGAKLSVKADLGRLLNNCLTDADAMYLNQGKLLVDKYGYPERQSLYNWWSALKAMQKDLTRQKKFAAAKTVALVQSKTVETAYNYYQIEAQKISDKLWVVILSLAFYVVYTLWYGFAIMFLFEGVGMRLEH
jgi:hypothetical protein